MNDDPKHTARVTQEFLEAKKLDILPLPSQGPNLKPTGDFQFLKTKLKVAGVKD